MRDLCPDRQDNNLSIQIDLVDVGHDSQIWGARYEGDASDLVHTFIFKDGGKLQQEEVAWQTWRGDCHRNILL